MENKYKYQKVLILGSGQLAYRCAEIVKAYIEDVKVLELKVTDSTILEKMCTKSSILYMCTTRQEMTALLTEEKASTLIVSAGNTYLFPAKVIAKKNLTIINWHNALLPRHKGRNAEVWAIYDGDKQTGVTWHYVSEDVDAGNIISQKSIDIGDEMTAMKLYKQQSALGEAMFAECIEDVLQDRCPSDRQSEGEKHQMHYSYEVPNDGWLDTEWPLEKISRFLRAMDYGSLLLMGRMYVLHEGRKYSFYRYKIKNSSEWTPVRTITENEGNIVILDQDKEIILRDIQEEK